MTSNYAPTRGDVLQAIRVQAVNDATRYVMDRGWHLSYAEVDDLGAVALDWVRSRLSCDIRQTDDGYNVVPRRLG